MAARCGAPRTARRPTRTASSPASGRTAAAIHLALAHASERSLLGWQEPGKLLLRGVGQREVDASAVGPEAGEKPVGDGGGDARPHSVQPSRQRIWRESRFE